MLMSFFKNLKLLILDLLKLFSDARKLFFFILFLPFSFIYYIYLYFAGLFFFIFYIYVFMFKYILIKLKYISNSTVVFYFREDSKNMLIFYLTKIFLTLPSIYSYLLFYKFLQTKKNKITFLNKIILFFNNFIIFIIRKIWSYILFLPINVFKINLILTNEIININKYKYSDWIAKLSTFFLNLTLKHICDLELNFSENKINLISFYNEILKKNQININLNPKSRNLIKLA